MRISSVSNINFKRQLKSYEEADFANVVSQAKEKVGNTGNSIFIVPSSSLPQNVNTGVGNLLDKEALKFFDFVKLYFGTNCIQLLPEGRFKNFNNCILPYSGSSIDLGEQLINLEKLTTNNFGKILSSDDLNVVQDFNSKFPQNKINYANVIEKKSPTDLVLRKAFKELQKADTDKKKEILKEILKFEEANREWLEPKSIYEALSFKYGTNDYYHWNYFDKNFYNTDVVSLEERINAIKGIKNCELNDEIEFYKFKQFLADKHLSEAKTELNNKGLKLSGDMIIGFSKDECWANPKAFIPNSSINWGLPALNYDSKEGCELLKLKVKVYAKRYDAIRFDAAWAYITQPVVNDLTHNKEKKEYNEKILNLLEDEIKNIKGANFNKEDLMYEMVADTNDFNLFFGYRLKSIARKRNKIFCSSSLDEYWATVDGFKSKGMDNNFYILGTTNHDSEPIRETFANESKRITQIETLSKILKIPNEKLASYSEFLKAKFAEPMLAKHNMVFFTEALNIIERYKDNPNMEEDYRVRIVNDYKENYFKSLEKGEGFNIMDALEKIFIKEGLDKKERKLYKKIQKYNRILQNSETKTSPKALLYTGIALGGSILAIILYKITHNKKRADKSALTKSINPHLNMTS